jgi:hypothetical protein
MQRYSTLQFWKGKVDKALETQVKVCEVRDRMLEYMALKGWWFCQPGWHSQHIGISARRKPRKTTTSAPRERLPRSLGNT